MRRLILLVAVLAAASAATGTALAAWSANSTSASGNVKALAMPTGTTPTAPTTSTGSVTLTWTAAQLAGADLTTYNVTRYPAAGGAGTAITCASQTITTHTVSCTYAETASGSYQYTDTPTKNLWVGTESAKSGTTVVTVATTFTVSVPSGNQTAGTAFNVTLTAKTGGVTDLTYTGSHTIAFSGPANSPSGQAPTYPATVSFTNGVGTASVTLFKAATATLTATEATPSRSGSTSVTVVAGAQKTLSFSVACPGPTVAKSSTWTSAVDILDQWGNATAQGTSATTIGVSRSPANGSLDVSSVTVAANANPAESGNFTYTADTGGNKASTITAAVAGLTSASCLVSTP